MRVHRPGKFGPAACAEYSPRHARRLRYTVKSLTETALDLRSLSYDSKALTMASYMIGVPRRYHNVSSLTCSNLGVRLGLAGTLHSKGVQGAITSHPRVLEGLMRRPFGHPPAEN